MSKITTTTTTLVPSGLPPTQVGPKSTPYGGASENAGEDTEDYIGERYDVETGQQYLNDRYYSPTFGMFVQPDWWQRPARMW